MKHIKKFNENNNWNILNQDDFEGKLEKWKSIHIHYNHVTLDNLFQVLDSMRIDTETLNTKYPDIKYKINLGNRRGDLPFIEIES